MLFKPRDIKNKDIKNIEFSLLKEYPIHLYEMNNGKRYIETSKGLFSIPYNGAGVESFRKLYSMYTGENRVEILVKNTSNKKTYETYEIPCDKYEQNGVIEKLIKVYQMQSCNN